MQPFFWKELFFLALKKGCSLCFFLQAWPPIISFNITFKTFNDPKKGHLIHRPDCFLSDLYSVSALNQWINQLADINWYYSLNVTNKTLQKWSIKHEWVMFRIATRMWQLHSYRLDNMKVWRQEWSSWMMCVTFVFTFCSNSRRCPASFLHQANTTSYQALRALNVDDLQHLRGEMLIYLMSGGISY